MKKVSTLVGLICSAMIANAQASDSGSTSDSDRKPPAPTEGGPTVTPTGKETQVDNDKTNRGGKQGRQSKSESKQKNKDTSQQQKN